MPDVNSLNGIGKLFNSQGPKPSVKPEVNQKMNSIFGQSKTPANVNQESSGKYYELYLKANSGQPLSAKDKQEIEEWNKNNPTLKIELPEGSKTPDGVPKEDLAQYYESNIKTGLIFEKVKDNFGN